MGIGFGKTYVVAVASANTNFNNQPPKSAFQGIQKQINAVNVSTLQSPSQVTASPVKLSRDLAVQIRHVKSLSEPPINQGRMNKSPTFQEQLKIQENMLKAACRSLRLWGVQDQRYFKAVFAQADVHHRGGLRDKKEEIYQQLAKMLDLNQSMGRKVSSHAAIPLDFALPYPTKQMKTFCTLVYLTPIEKSLQGQRKMLEAPRDQLKQWHVDDQKRFRSIFGHSVISKRANVYSQIDKMLEQNKNCFKLLTKSSMGVDVNLADLKIPSFTTTKLEKYCALAYQQANGKR